MSAASCRLPCAAGYFQRSGKVRRGCKLSEVTGNPLGWVSNSRAASQGRARSQLFGIARQGDRACRRIRAGCGNHGDTTAGNANTSKDNCSALAPGECRSLTSQRADGKAVNTATDLPLSQLLQFGKIECSVAKRCYERSRRGAEAQCSVCWHPCRSNSTENDVEFDRGKHDAEQDERLGRTSSRASAFSVPGGGGRRGALDSMKSRMAFNLRISWEG